MVESEQKGFTLIEIVLVMAISGMLFVIALAGQRDLRDRAQFDASINQIVSNISDARNEALANVNLDGTGDGSVNVAGCPSVPKVTVFAGTSWTADNNLPGTPLMMEYWKTDIVGSAGSNSCVFHKQSIGLPWASVSVTANTRVLFIRNDLGGLVVCKVSSTNNPGVDERSSFNARACTAPASAIVPGTPLRLFFNDGVGHQGEVDVDSSGLASRKS